MGERDCKNEVEAEEGSGEMGSDFVTGSTRLLGSSVSREFNIVLSLGGGRVLLGAEFEDKDVKIRD